MTRQWITNSLDETLRTGALIGRRLKGGEVIFLHSDVGGGKTAFTRGIVGAIGDPSDVASPSFTINNTYMAGDITIEHFDFYRLSEPGIMKDEFSEASRRPRTVVIVEWGDTVEETVLPDERVDISITSGDGDTRMFEASFSEACAYLFEEVT